jgi:hypothetical protein
MSTTTPSNLVPCGRCAQMMDGTRAAYSKQGELICRSCESADTIDEGYMRAARSSCLGALGTGVLSIFFDPFYIVSIAAVVQGIRAIVLLNRPEYRTALGDRRTRLMAAAVVGTLAGTLRLALLVLTLAAAASMR